MQLRVYSEELFVFSKTMHLINLKSDSTSSQQATCMVYILGLP